MKAIRTRQGSFVAPTVTGTQAITGLGFQPKALLLMSASQAVNDASFANGGNLSLGYVAGPTSRVCCAMAMEDNLTGAGAMNNGKMLRNASALCGLKPSGTTFGLDFVVDLTSFDSDGFTLNWTDAPDTAIYVYYLAIGGPGLTGAKAGTITTARTTAGNQAYTGIGFQPDCLLFSGTQGVSANAIGNGAQLFVGACTSTVDQYTCGNTTPDAITTQTGGVFGDAAHVIKSFNNGTNTIDMSALLSSFDSDGFTLNWDDPSSSASNILCYLALNTSGNAKVYVETSPTGAGNVSKSGLPYKPSGLFAFGVGVPSTQTSTTGNRLCLGMGDDALNQAACGVSANVGVTTSLIRRRAFPAWIVDHLHTGGGTNSIAQITAATADGHILAWVTPDTTNRKVGILSFGPSVDPANFMALT